MIFALVAIFSCSGTHTGEAETQIDRSATIAGAGLCRVSTLDAAAGTSTDFVREMGIGIGNPIVGYFRRAVEVLAWNASPTAVASGRVEFEAEEGNGAFDLVQGPNKTVVI